MLVTNLINRMLMNEAEFDGAAGGSAVASTSSESESLSPDAQVFEALADEFDNEDLESPEPAPTESKPVVPATPVAQPATPVAPTTPTPAATPTPPVSAVQEVPQQTPVVQSPTQSVPQAPSRDQAVASIAQQLAITNEDDIIALRTEPEKVIPKLLANLFYDIHATLSRQWQESLPNALQEVSTKAKADLESENSFFGRWPGLADHKQLVVDTAKLYRKMNPQADVQTAIAEIGALAMLKAKIPFDTVTGKPITPAAQPTNQHFKPVGTGSSGVNTNLAADNPWETLAAEFENEDRTE